MTTRSLKHFSHKDQKVIRDEALLAERQGRWTAAMYQLAFRKDLFRKMVPSCYGGGEVSLPVAMEIVEEASTLDGSFGWTLTLGMGAGIFGAYLEPEMAASIFSKPDAYIAGSGYPGGDVVPTDTGYRIRGRWKYITGSDIATAFTAALKFPVDGGEDQVRAVILEPRQVRIEHTWTSYGLVATASHDEVIKDLEIDHSRVFDLIPGTARVDAPLNAYPFMGMATAHIAACAMGMAAGFLEAAEELLRGRAEPQKALAELEQQRNSFQERRSDFLAKTGETWTQIEESGQVEAADLEAMETAAVEAVQSGLASAQRVYPLLGMAVLPRESRANRAWRDLLTASQHSLVNKKG